MAGNNYRKLGSGESLRGISRSTYNALLDNLQKSKQEEFDGGAGTPRHTLSQTVVTIRNSSGTLVPRYGVLQLAEPLVTAAQNEVEFLNRITFDGVAPTTQGVADGLPFAVLLEPLPDGHLGRAVVVGAVPVLLHVADESHRAAGPVAQKVTHLRTADCGPATILWVEPPGDGESVDGTLLRNAYVLLTQGVNCVGDELTVETLSTTNLTVTNSVTVNNDVSIGDDLSVTDDVTVGGDLSVTNVTVTNSVTINNDLSVGDDVTVTGDVTTANLTVTNSATVNNDLSVGDDLSVTDDVTVGGDLSVTNVTVTNSVTINNDLSVGDDVTVTGDVTTANLTVTGDASVGDDLAVTGDVTAASLTTTGDVSVGDDLTVIGDTTLGLLVTGPNGGMQITGGPGSGDDLVLISTSHGTPGTIDVKTTSGDTTSVREVVRLRHLTTNTADVGFGVRLTFSLEDASGNEDAGGAIDLKWTDATHTSEDADLLLLAMRAGTLTEQVRATSTGALRLGEVSAPATPASGTVLLYGKSDGFLYSKDDAGTETQLGGGGGAQLTETNGSATLGGAYTLSGSSAQDTGLEVTLPDAGTYHLTCTFVVNYSDTFGANSLMQGILRDSTEGVDVLAQDVVRTLNGSNTHLMHVCLSCPVVTDGDDHVIKLRASHSGFGTVSAVVSGGAILSYVRIE